VVVCVAINAILKFSRSKTLLSICFFFVAAYVSSIWFISLDFRINHYGHQLYVGWSILKMIMNSGYLLSHWIFTTMYLRLAKLVISEKIISKRDNRCINILVYTVAVCILVNCIA